MREPNAHVYNFFCASDCSGKDSQTPFIPLESKLRQISISLLSNENELLEQ